MNRRATLFLMFLSVSPASAQVIDPVARLKTAAQLGVTDHAGNERARANREKLVALEEAAIRRDHTPEGLRKQEAVLSAALPVGGASQGIAAARRFFELRRAAVAAGPTVGRILESHAVGVTAGAALDMCRGGSCTAPGVALDVVVGSYPGLRPLTRVVGGRADRLLTFPGPPGTRVPADLLVRPSQAAAAAITCLNCGHVATGWAVDAGVGGIGVAAMTTRAMLRAGDGVVFANSASNRATGILGTGAVRALLRGGNAPGAVRSQPVLRGDLIDLLERMTETPRMPH